MRQNSRQGYEGPFLIKCNSKGWFSCDLGMIDSIDIRKGGASNQEWSSESYPTEIDVTLNIKDMYPTIMMTMNESITHLFFNNTGLLELLDSMAGIQMHKMNHFSSFYAALGMLMTQFKETITLERAEDWVINKLSTTVGRTFKLLGFGH